MKSGVKTFTLASGLAIASAVAAQDAAPPPAMTTTNTGLYANVSAVLSQRFYRLIAKHKPVMADVMAQRAAVQNLLAEIPASHLALLSQATFDRLIADLAGTAVPSAGFDVVQLNGRYFATNLLEGGAGEAAGIRNGDEIVSLQGVPTRDSPLLDWRSDDAYLDEDRDPPLHFLKVSAGERIATGVRRAANGPVEEWMVVAKIDSSRDASSRSVRRIEQDGRVLGYVHLWYIYLQGASDIVRDALAGPLKDADGLILDLRGRGGSGTEIPALLAVLDQAHRDRALPVVGLIDRQTRSAKDVIARALAKRPWVRLVGEPTAGAVIPASFAPVGDGAVLMFPSFALGTLTQEMENQGGVAPSVMATRSIAYADDKDPILEAGLQALASGPRGFAAGPAAGERPESSERAKTAPSVAPDWLTLKAQMLAALGGEAAVRQWRARKLEGRAEIVGLPMTGTYRQVTDPSGRFRIDANFGSLAITQGFDGEAAWTKNPQTGVSRANAAMTARLRTQSGFFGPLDWDREGREVLRITGAIFDDKPSFELILRDEAGELSLFVDAASKWLIGMRSEIDSPMGRIPSTTTFSNYKDFEGLPLPTVILVEAAGQKQRYVIERVIFGPVDAGEFAMPAG
jgi:C-terminal processing protease CtpA/Prc